MIEFQIISKYGMKMKYLNRWVVTMLKFTYKKIDGEEEWKYVTSERQFTINRYNDHYSLTVRIGCCFSQFNFKTILEASNFIELNY